MNDSEVKKLKREELLEMLIESEKKCEDLRKTVEEQKMEISELEFRLSKRLFDIREAGNIAEAALKLNGIFEAAQASADQYLENLRVQMNFGKEDEENLKRKTQETCDRMLEEAEADSERVRTETETYCRDLLKEAVSTSEAVKAAADEYAEKQKEIVKQETDRYWDEVSQKLQNFYDSHKGLAQMITLLNEKHPSMYKSGE